MDSSVAGAEAMSIPVDSVSRPEAEQNTDTRRKQNFRQQQDRVRESIDAISADLSLTKFSVLLEFGKNICNYLKTINAERKKYEWIPTEIVDLVSKCLGDDNDANERIIAMMAVILGNNTRKSRLSERVRIHREEGHIKKSGNRSLSSLTKSIIHNEWLENSIPSNDRRLGREKVAILKAQFEQQYGGIDMAEGLVKHSTQRNALVVIGESHIATCTTQKIRKKNFMKYDTKVCIGSVHAYKPFFVGNATNREMALCLCKFCLNLRKMFEALNSVLKDQGKPLFDSMSSYFMHHCMCAKAPISYWGYKCCKGLCKECADCPLPDLDVDDRKVPITYFNFVTKQIPYVVTRGKDKGKTKMTTRCERETFKKSFEEVKLTVDMSRYKYLLHRYLVQQQKFIFNKFRQSIPQHGDIFWIDMSENIANVPKEQCQDAHFNQKQSSLCCTVQIHGPNSSDNTFHYHLSDYNTHNISYTGAVFEDLYHLPSSNDMAVFRVKSDNCATQFKDRYVFGFWKNFAKVKKTPVLVFYSVAGHGKGLVDSMSSFGVKQPIRNAIINDNYWYNDSNDLKKKLSLMFLEDERKKYYVLDEEDLVKRDEDKSKFEQEIKGCQKMVMVSFFPDGTIFGAKNYCACDNCIVGRFDRCSGDICDGGKYDCKKGLVKVSGIAAHEEDGSEDVIADIVDEDECEIVVDDFGILEEMYTPGSFIALNSSTHFKQFYLCKVHKVCKVNDDHVEDTMGHCFRRDEVYVRANYLSLVKEKRGIFHYKEDQTEVFINPRHIIFPCVDVSDELTITISEYHDICANI